MKKKILHILVSPKLAGAQKISLEIFSQLSSDEFEKWILFSDELDDGYKKVCQKAFEDVDVKVIYSSKLKREIGLWDFGALREIYRLCREEKFDIVHTHSTKPGIIGRIAATLARVPLVVHTVHGLAFHKFIKFPKWQFYWCCEMFSSLFCDKITMVNRYYGKYFKWCKRKVSTIYNGIDFSKLPEIERQPSDRIRILFVGRLDTAKDPLTLLQVARIVIEKHPTVLFTLVGDGEKYLECKEFITYHKLQDNVELAGWQNDVSKYYANADIFAMPSIYESFGLIFLEAAHYKLPVIATNVEGIPEVVEDGVTGLLCNPRDIEQMSKNIIRLIEDPLLSAKLGSQGKERANTIFTINSMSQQYELIYKKS